MLAKRTTRGVRRGGAGVFGWVMLFACVGGCAIRMGGKDPEPEYVPPTAPPEAPTTPVTTVAKVSGSSTARASATPTSRPTAPPTTAPTAPPTSPPTTQPTARPTTVPSSTPSTSPSSTPSNPGDGWTLTGGTGAPVPNGECTGCAGSCGDEAEGPHQTWSAYFNEGKLVMFNVSIVGATDPVEMSRDDLAESVKDGGTVSFKVPKDPPNGDVKLHVVGDKAEVKLGNALVPGTCVWEEAVPEPMD